jgi:hypothetical protein
MWARCIFAVCVWTSCSVFAHIEAENRISLRPQSSAAISAGSFSYQFQLFDQQKQKNITAADLKETHTKLLHLIIFDASLNEFQHVHPENTNNLWSVPLEFARNGTYFVWAQGELKDGTDFSTYGKAQVIKGKPAWDIKPLGDRRVGEDRSTVVSLDPVKLHASQMAMINFKVTRNDGQSPAMSPYLGALAHVIATAPDGKSLIHVHPMGGSEPNTGMIHTTFPVMGDYRIWIQFNDHDTLKTIPLSVHVEP